MPTTTHLQIKDNASLVIAFKKVWFVGTESQQEQKKNYHIGADISHRTLDHQPLFLWTAVFPSAIGI
jgi:hypothetical protein